MIKNIAKGKRKVENKKAGAGSKQPDRPENGVIIRGADGKMYFIPDKALKSFKLPERSGGPAREILDQAGELPPVRKLGELTFLPALQGPIGLRARDFNAVAINPTIPGKISLSTLLFDK